uniref:Uncharacterized protein n=1 Tax=viral metagenome TaxID=1070528 RepID=A0A6C0HTB7_9ZZZZ
MKYYETHYEEYVSSVNKMNLHPENLPIIKTLPNEIDKLTNIIFYGASGVGKYSQSLYLMKKYSPSDLKYEKKITIQTEKQEYNYKISDIHFEIDMSLLGCNSKILWNEIFLQIIDIVSVKQNKTGIILCKNFHLIHSELLEIFYSYMQQYNSIYSNIKIFFFILTEQLSFIPTKILNVCHLLRIQRPSKDLYKKLYNNNSIELLETISLESIVNIKEIRSFHLIKDSNNIPKDVFNTICDSIIEWILVPDKIEFTNFRDVLYDILTYNLDVAECIWYILTYFVNNNHLSSKNITDILIQSYYFFKYYNNNYRPIYHLESIIFYIIIKVHGY